MDETGDHTKQYKLDPERHIAYFLRYGEKHVKFVECRLYTYTHDTRTEEELFGKVVGAGRDWTGDNYRQSSQQKYSLLRPGDIVVEAGSMRAEDGEKLSKTLSSKHDVAVAITKPQ